jgi:hypothetical protein
VIFVAQVLADANERLDRRYKLKSLGIDLEKVTDRVCRLYDVERRLIFSREWQKRMVSGRSDLPPLLISWRYLGR